MMPGETGFEFARKLRTSSSVPILMLTARGEAESRIQGLEIGADDYVGKPFEPRELSLRVASILKRARPAATPPVEFVRFGEFVFHIGRGELKRGEEVVHLTDREREMLTLLAATPGRDRAARWRWPATAAMAATAARSASAPSTCRSTGCAARSSAIPPIRCSCRPCAASATGWW